MLLQKTRPGKMQSLLWTHTWEKAPQHSGKTCLGKVGMTESCAVQQHSVRTLILLLLAVPMFHAAP